MVAIGSDEKAFAALPADLWAAYSHFAGRAVETHCSSECRRILALGAPLLDAADPAARPEIWRGIVSALVIICVG